MCHRSLEDHDARLHYIADKGGKAIGIKCMCTRGIHFGRQLIVNELKISNKGVKDVMINQRVACQ
jgi:hypothetical protein